MIVICLEGCHGSGKTALTAACRDMGFSVMDEGFMSQPPTLLHPQSLLMETAWVCGWFQRVMSHIVEIRKSGEAAKHHVIIADRSPLSAVFYSKSDGHLLEPLIRQYVDELKAVSDVHIHTVHLRTERSLLWNRIQSRLAREPNRLALGEDSEDWMDRVLAFYDSMKWDVTVRNDESGMNSLLADVLGSLARHSSAVLEAVQPTLEKAVALASLETSAVSDDEMEASLPALSTPVKPHHPAAAAVDAGALEAAAMAMGQGVSPTAPLNPEVLERVQSQAVSASARQGGIGMSVGF